MTAKWRQDTATLPRDTEGEAYRVINPPPGWDEEHEVWVFVIPGFSGGAAVICTRQCFAMTHPAAREVQP